MIEKHQRAKQFNQGFETVEYTSSALVDQALHCHPTGDINVDEFEAEELKRLGMPREIVMRHRPAHFQRKKVFLL